MKKILLSSAGGFSTSLLVNKMKEEANKSNKNYQIKAVSADLISNLVEKDMPDCILLGPQIRYMVDGLKPITEKNNIPLAVIPIQDYGRMNGLAVLKQAERLMQIWYIQKIYKLKLYWNEFWKEYDLQNSF